MDKLNALKNMLERAGIELILSTSHSPWMVGKGERANRAIMERMRAMIIWLFLNTSGMRFSRLQFI